jgi:hypothetical protein
MSNQTQNVTLLVELDDEARPEEVNRLTTQLYRQLMNSQAEAVEKVRSEGLEVGAKGDPLTIGAIALAMGVAVAPEIVKLVGDWLKRRHLETVSVKIKLGEDEIEFPAPAASSPEKLEALTERFVALLQEHGGSDA